MQRRNPFTFVALFGISFYRAFLSGLFGGTCRYEPSCSCYAQQAFTEHPPFAAFRLTLGRLLRCHPWASFGPDPVPTRHSHCSARQT